MNLQSNENSEWGESLKDFAPEYAPVKCFSILQFFRMRGRTERIIRENIEPINELHYCLFSPAEKRYYLKLYRDWQLDQLRLYSKASLFSEDYAVENLKSYINDGNIWLLLNETQVVDTRDVMRRIWTSSLPSADIDYRRFYPLSIRIIEEKLRLEDYEDYGRSLPGFKTACNQMNESIQALWREASEMVKVK